MSRHRVDCPHCLWGQVRMGALGGTQFMGPCGDCDGTGNVFVDDEHGLIDEGSIITSLHEPNWQRFPTFTMRANARERQWKAEANGVRGYGADEVTAVRRLVAETEIRACEIAAANEEAWRCREVS